MKREVTPEPDPFQRKRRLINLLSMTAVAILAVLLYSRALDFAFFNDDPSGHFAWMEGRSFLDFFRSSAEYGYYRPIVFVVLKGLVTAVAYYAPLFHALLLLLHGANVALLWLLAFWLTGERPYAWAVALIFATVPFSYEAVAYVASLTHPLLTFWALLTLLFYWRAREAGSGDGERNGRSRSSRTIYYLAAFTTLILALFTHENGLLIPLALAGLEWLLRRPRGVLEGVKRPFLPTFIPAILFFFLWLAIPKAVNKAPQRGPPSGVTSSLSCKHSFTRSYPSFD